jgi:hypothetical protein
MVSQLARRVKRAMGHSWELLQELSTRGRNEFLAKLALTASLLSGFVDSWSCSAVSSVVVGRRFRTSVGEHSWWPSRPRLGAP